MESVALIEEIEDLLFDKLKRQEKCLKYYELIDDSVRSELLIRTFDKIDHELEEILKIDLQFLTKFDKLKRQYGIKTLDELPTEGRNVFEMIQNAVVLTSKRQNALDVCKTEASPYRDGIQKAFLDENRKAFVASAYKNINK